MTDDNSTPEEIQARIERAQVDGNEIADKIIDLIQDISPDHFTGKAFAAGVVGLVNALAYLVACGGQFGWKDDFRLWLYQEFVPAVIIQIEVHEKNNRVEH